MDFKEHFTSRVGKADGSLLRMQIFIAFAILIHKKGKKESNQRCKKLDTAKYTLPMPLKEIVHYDYGQIEFVCPNVRYEIDYFKNIMDLANLYDCLVEEMEKFND